MTLEELVESLHRRADAFETDECYDIASELRYAAAAVIECRQWRSVNFEDGRQPKEWMARTDELAKEYE